MGRKFGTFGPWLARGGRLARPRPRLFRPRPQLTAFAAADTRWPHQPHFGRVETQLAAILARCGAAGAIGPRRYAVQRANGHLFRGGVKPLMMNMIEAAIQLADGPVVGREVRQLLGLGKRLLDLPSEPLPGAVSVLAHPN